MKSLILSVATIATFSASAYNLTAYPTEDQKQVLCEAVKQNNKSKFNWAVRDITSVVMQVKKRDVLAMLQDPAKFQCEGQDLNSFTRSQQANNIADLLGIELEGSALAAR